MSPACDEGWLGWWLCAPAVATLRGAGSAWLRESLPGDVGLEARRAEGVPLVVRLDAAAGVKEGDGLELFLGRHALHLFDPHSGRAAAGPLAKRQGYPASPAVRRGRAPSARCSRRG